MSNINFNGYMENVLTFECDDDVNVGDLVSMKASGKVGKAAADSAFIGVCVSVKNGIAAVQLSGYIEKKKGGTVNLGFTKLVAAADGVKTGNAGKEFTVIYSDDSTVGFIL